MKTFLLLLFIFCLESKCQSQKTDTIQAVHTILMGKWADTSDIHHIFYFKKDSLYLMNESGVIGRYVCEVHKLFLSKKDTINYKNIRLTFYDNTGEEAGHYFDISILPKDEIFLSPTVHGDRPFVLRKMTQ